MFQNKYTEIMHIVQHPEGDSLNHHSVVSDMSLHCLDVAF